MIAVSDRFDIKAQIEPGRNELETFSRIYGERHGRQ